MLNRWSAAPLGFRLIVVATALMLLGVSAAGMVSASVMRSYMLDQVDAELTGSARGLAQGSLDQLLGRRGEENVLPSDYYVRVQLEDGRVGEFISAATDEAAGRPAVRDVDLEELDGLTGPMTIRGTDRSVPWRAVAIPVADTTGGTVGAVTVAVPLAALESTLANVRVAIVLTAALVSALGALLAFWLVRRELRPLQEIERTAETIAAGDLSRRVREDLPLTTEVGSLARSLNVMLAQIEQAFAERSASEARMRRFVSDASHELRTPLATIRGYGELYRMGGVPADQLPDAMNRIESEAKRMGVLVEDLLQLARLDEGRPLELTELDLRSVARDAVTDLAALAPDRAARVVPLDDGPEEPRAEVLAVADDARLHQVVTNLVGNVLQHTPAGTPVEIAVGYHPTEPEWAILQVRDHGPGIPPEDAQRVFERFYRVDRSRNRSSGGSGLGLAIAAAIVASVGGAMRVRQTDGGGTTVEVALRRPSMTRPQFPSQES